MNLEEISRYLERRMADVGLSLRIDSAGYQAIQKYTNGDKDRLNQLYYKLVSVGSRQEKHEINGATIQIAIDDLRRMDEFMDHLPLELDRADNVDIDRITIEQLASGLERKVAEEIKSAVAEARRKAAEAVPGQPAVGGNGADHSESAVTLAAAGVQARGTPGKPRVLVVDDSPTIRAAVIKALENDFELIEASDGRRAWELLGIIGGVKLVVTDLMMPGMDGMALIELIRAAASENIASLPIIVVTGTEDPQAKVNALMAGANDFITKRTDTMELQARVIARYQLSQIVGNSKYTAGDTGARTGKELSPASHRLGHAPAGTKPNGAGAGNANRATPARRRENGVHAQRSGTAAVTHIDIPPRAASSAAGPGQSGRKANRLAQLSSTMVITIVASLLVAGAMFGFFYANRWEMRTTSGAPDISASNSGNATTALAANSGDTHALDPASTDPATTAHDSNVASTDSWTTADGTPVHEDLDSPPSSKGEAPKQTTSIAATAPTSTSEIERPTAKTTPKPTAKATSAEESAAMPNNKKSSTPAAKHHASKEKTSVAAAAPAAGTRSSSEIAPKRSSITASSAGAAIPKKKNSASEPKKTTSIAASTAAAPPVIPRSATSVSAPDTIAALEPSVPPSGVSPAVEPNTAPAASAKPNPASNPTVTAALAPRAMSAQANNQLTQAELSNLLSRFTAVYEAGDLQQFLSLFSDKIHTNDRSDKAGLRQDYADLFRTTVMRQITIGDIVWDINGPQAQGAANFEVRVRKANDGKLHVYRGSISFQVEKNNGRLEIMRMYHGQWKATG